MAKLYALCAVVFSVTYANAQSTSSQHWLDWGTLCPAGWSCNVVNPYYYQCLPGSATGTSTTTSGSSSFTTTSTSTSTATAPGSTSTLLPGNSFIRSVEDPYFHYYLQSITPGVATAAIMGSYTSAAQFQITNGQLVQQSTPPLPIPLLLNWVFPGAKTPATNGTFDFSGDTIEWSIPTITRPQLNAWLVCPDSAGNNLLYVNLGFYDYMTPSGCADETIHFYTGATPVPRK
ncbi:hypothetical protein BT96DRAFT_962102 [Gymnopus androsaceus JB14]|uniref:CBM1 domain-containing protein n=1 Tax=Gymnopus androsaceus JB14 TaxID=1447944 RepID=A0A6A4ID45_9AGAR|nr:hypothetical protein BT96DRAFT_962102 [Gymnopus androsaceus JB14]